MDLNKKSLPKISLFNKKNNNYNLSYLFLKKKIEIRRVEKRRVNHISYQFSSLFFHFYFYTLKYFVLTSFFFNTFFSFLHCFHLVFKSFYVQTYHTIIVYTHKHFGSHTINRIDRRINGYRTQENSEYFLKLIENAL